MTKRKKHTCKKISVKADASCYYCEKKTAWGLYDPKDDSEVWTCEDCLWKVGKIKKFRPKVMKHPTLKEKEKISSVLCVKNITTAPIRGISEVVSL